MKILFILENYLPHVGGVETVFRNLAERMVKLGHKVSIVTHRLKGTKKYEVMNGVKVHRVSCFQSRYLFTFLAIPSALRLAKDALWEIRRLAMRIYLNLPKDHREVLFSDIMDG